MLFERPDLSKILSMLDCLLSVMLILSIVMQGVAPPL